MARQDSKAVAAPRIRSPTLAQRKVLLYDQAGEEHFNLISALHKSLRESDPDAALYWLARMLAAGEDPLYLARRMVRFASEDVGLADPQALPQALAAWEAYHRLGLTGGRAGAGPGSDLPGAGAEEQRGLRGLLGGSSERSRSGPPSRSRMAYPQRTDPAHERSRLRPGHVYAHATGRGHGRHGVPARVPGGQALLLPSSSPASRKSSRNDSRASAL